MPYHSPFIDSGSYFDFDLKFYILSEGIGKLFLEKIQFTLFFMNQNSTFSVITFDLKK